MANFIIDGNLFKNIQSSIKRDTERFLGKGNGVSIQLSEIREFVVENQQDMFSNGGKQWVVDHFVNQVKNQQNSLTVSVPTKEDIIIGYNYTPQTPSIEKQNLPVPATDQTQITVPTQQPQSSALGLPTEILAEVQNKFSNYSQELQQEVISHLQELKLQSALELREKLNELSNLESTILLKIFSDYKQQHESNLSNLRQNLSQTKSEVSSKSENFTQQFKDRNRQIAVMFNL